MKNCKNQSAQAGFDIVKPDATVSEHDDLAVEALSRWENDGGAPERRSEFDNPQGRESRVHQFTQYVFSGPALIGDHRCINEA